MSGLKFWRKPIMFVWTALLISLSSKVLGNEPRKCYWCGPLAEQVHRSHRAPPCNVSDLHETTCDEGYKHCAIVAMTPPFTESRLCVKLYKPECYSVFCNSTRTWRTVCPCRGDLCNGRNTDKEIKAFTDLRKHVAQRQKRNLISGNFINSRKYQINNINVTNNVSEELNAMDMDVISTIGKPESLKTENGGNSDETEVETMKMEDTTTINVEEVQIENSVPTGTVAEFVETTQSKDMNALQETKGTQSLPTPEALQQNASPVDKATETTTDTTIQSMNENKMETKTATEPTMTTQPSKNNTAVTINNVMLTPIISVLLHLHM